MPSNKPRLYVGLYARGGASHMPGGEDKYHWALILGPKGDAQNAKGVRYDAKEQLTADGNWKWVFQELVGGFDASGMLLVRITIAKLAKRGQAASILRSVPVKQGAAGWNCVAWVREALEELQRHPEVLGTRRLEWQDIRDTAMWYIEKKKREHRFDGQGDFDTKKIPTYDLIEREEIVS